MTHIRRITVAKADTSGDDGIFIWPGWWSVDAITELLGGSILDVLLALTEAKGKGDT